MNTLTNVNYNMVNEAQIFYILHLYNMHLLNKFVDNIYVLYINQAEHNNIKEKIDELGLKVEYFKGVNGSMGNLYANYEKWYNNNNANIKLSKGSFGHISSFLKIINDAILKNYSKIILFEPDIYLCDNFELELEKYKDLIENSKLFYLGANQNMFYSETTWNHIDIEGNHYKCYKTLGTFAVIIDKSIFKEIYDQCSLMTEPSDVCLTHLQAKYRKKCIVSYPNLICCDVTESMTASGRNQLTTMEKLHWTKKYIFDNCHYYMCEKDKLYKFEFLIDSSVANPCVKIHDGDKNILIIEKRLFNALVNNNLFIVYLKPENTSIKIITKNIFTRTPSIIRTPKTSFEVHKQRLRYSIKNTELQKYYSKII